jgi:hypothetical protein
MDRRREELGVKPVVERIIEGALKRREVAGFRNAALDIIGGAGDRRLKAARQKPQIIGPRDRARRKPRKEGARATA